ncbi:MAG: holo-ACP synthase [Holosporales bacterium]|jgi:phosphopantetheine--protein transferase-like protein|nr:holo-ACP synthase [Holosporales bacterium]
MIIGAGVDILDTRRIERLVTKFGSQFERRIFTQAELAFCCRRDKYIESLAKMFSLKEAMIKAISDVSGIRWHEIEVFHNDLGRPVIELTGTALIKAEQKSQFFKVEATTSDEPPYVAAFVIMWA